MDGSLDGLATDREVKVLGHLADDPVKVLGAFFDPGFDLLSLFRAQFRVASAAFGVV